MLQSAVVNPELGNGGGAAGDVFKKHFPRGNVKPPFSPIIYPFFHKIDHFGSEWGRGWPLPPWIRHCQSIESSVAFVYF